MDPLSLLSMYHDFEFYSTGSDSFMHVMTSHAKLLALTADQVGLRAASASTDIMLVRTGDLSAVISALDSLSDSDHRDQLNPFQAFLQNQPNKAPLTLQNPFGTQPDLGPAGEPRIAGSEDGEVISIELSGEETKKKQTEQESEIPQAAGRHPRKRKDKSEKFQFKPRKRLFRGKKQTERRHRHGSQPHPLGPQRQDETQGGALSGMENQQQHDTPLNAATEPMAMRQQPGGNGRF
ncbi:hypothetical protein F52700_6326 [Fusarium sp. NRRL 52700]|nr:hypothetical protein F52700_6326 [Fusarium sp. NRRL 52700]